MRRRRYPHRVTFIDTNKSKSARHELIESDKTVATRSGKLTPAGASSREIGEQFRGIASHTFACRYDAHFNTNGMKRELEVTFTEAGRTRRFSILGIYRKDERGREMSLILEELQA